MKKFIILALMASVSFAFILCQKNTVKDTVISDLESNRPAAETSEILPGNDVDESGISDISSHSGLFALTMSGYKGELFIGVSGGKFYGTVKFFNWGNGVPQPVSDLKVSEDKIYFKRSIKTREDLSKYGGTAYFEQEFYGIFTPDRKTIKGYYRYTGTQDNWEAVKK